MADLELESPIMRLPSEIRLMIYELLFDDQNNKTFSIRSQTWDSHHNRRNILRTKYRVIRPGLLRQSIETTYHLITPSMLYTNILAVNRQIHEEASPMLYARHSFDFGGDIEAMVPFLSDLTPRSRELVHDISLTKKGSAYMREFDRCEWENVCEFIAKDMVVRKLVLRVMGAKPPAGLVDIPTYTASDFKLLASVNYEGLEWVQALLNIRTLHELEVIPELEHCHPPRSSAMAFYISFSASIEYGFAEYLASEMLPN